MKYLLDTCAIIWFFGVENREMPERVFEEIEGEANEVFISVASIWELAIKYSLGKIDLPYGIDANFKNELENQGFGIIDISFEHATEVLKLPMHHKDPFDRLLISQCKVENLTAITNDKKWAHPDYGIQTFW